MKYNTRWYIFALLLYTVGTSGPAFAVPNITLKQTNTTLSDNISVFAQFAIQHGIYQLLLHGFSINYKNMLKLHALFLLSKNIVGFTNVLCHELGHAMTYALMGRNSSIVIDYNLMLGIMGFYSGGTSVSTSVGTDLESLKQYHRERIFAAAAGPLFGTIASLSTYLLAKKILGLKSVATTIDNPNILKALHFIKDICCFTALCGNLAQLIPSSANDGANILFDIRCLRYLSQCTTSNFNFRDYENYHHDQLP